MHMTILGTKYVIVKVIVIIFISIVLTVNL